MLIESQLLSDFYELWFCSIASSSKHSEPKPTLPTAVKAKSGLSVFETFEQELKDQPARSAAGRPLALLSFFFIAEVVCGLPCVQLQYGTAQKKTSLMILWYVSFAG